MNEYKYSLTEIENLIPFEREIYITLLLNSLKEKEERARQQNG